jgi:hypothetical protein
LCGCGVVAVVYPGKARAATLKVIEHVSNGTGKTSILVEEFCVLAPRLVNALDIKMLSHVVLVATFKYKKHSLTSSLRNEVIGPWLSEQIATKIIINRLKGTPLRTKELISWSDQCNEGWALAIRADHDEGNNQSIEMNPLTHKGTDQSVGPVQLRNFTVLPSRTITIDHLEEKKNE